MMVHVHGFDWASYTKNIMPAFALWLMNEEEQEAHKLYLETRCAQEEVYVPEAMQPLCAWPRARDFVHQLPRGPFAKREYQKLCIAEQFHLLSDRYVYRHPPQLYRESEALRTIWGACVEQYCLPWYHQLKQVQEDPEKAPEDSSNEFTTVRNELLDLLQTVGLNELAQELNEPTSTGEHKTPVLTSVEEQPATPAPLSLSEVLSEQENAESAENEEEEEEEADGPKGIFIGRLPTTLHLRGWLATQSIRAMALFEFLVCGRRCMPFGYQEGDPFGAYVGYLTPEEVQQLSACLYGAQPPSVQEAESDYSHFRQHRTRNDAPFRLIDEILPAHAQEFLQAVRSASSQDLGLICTIG